MLERIVREFLHNACKYTPAGETITIKTKANESEVSFCVINTGVEIPEEEQELILIVSPAGVYLQALCKNSLTILSNIIASVDICNSSSAKSKTNCCCWFCTRVKYNCASSGIHK
ncbi:MAG: ATP-binding protein [Cyanobacteria bacterium J06649_11]